MVGECHLDLRGWEEEQGTPGRRLPGSWKGRDGEEEGHSWRRSGGGVGGLWNDRRRGRGALRSIRNDF